MISWYAFISGLLSGLFLLSGFFSLFLFFRRIEREINIAYFFLALSLGGTIAHSLLGSAADVLPVAIFHDKVVNSFLCLAGISFLYLASYMTGYRDTMLMRVMVGGLLLFLIVNWILPYGITFTELHGIQTTRLLWGEERHQMHGETGIANLIAMGFILGILLFTALAVRHLLRHGDRRDAWSLFTVLSIGALGILIHTIMLAFDIPTIGILDNIGFLAFIFLIGHRNFQTLIRSNELIRESEERSVRLPEAAFEGIGFSANEEQNILLAQTLKSVRDCISITDLDDIVIFVNDAFLNTYGYTEAEVLGRHISMFRSPNTLQQSTERIFPTTQEGGWHGEVLNMRKDGTEFPIELWTSVVTDTAGNVLAHVGVARDISDRKASEQALIAEKNRAERSDRLKDAFIANISHEVRTPLNIILGYTGLISESVMPKASKEEVSYFDSVQRGAQRLMRTVDMILSISRLQVGDFEITPVPLLLEECAGEIVDDYRSAARNKNLELTLKIDDGGLSIMADEHSVVQSLHNLLDNALKYTHEGSICVRVFRASGGTACVSVSDTGIGISTEYLPAIFNPYTQEDSGYTRGYEGIGLGLSLVKRYAELNQAIVEIESAKGEGTTVTLSFPYRDSVPVPNAASAAAVADATVPMSPVDSGQRCSLLVVEDDSLTIEFMRTILARDYRLQIARTADEAEQALRSRPIDVILMDVSLSGEKNGLELTAELKASSEWSGIPVIATTAHAFPGDRERCLKAGCDAYLSKPVQKKQLIETIDQLHESVGRETQTD